MHGHACGYQSCKQACFWSVHLWAAFFSPENVNSVTWNLVPRPAPSPPESQVPPRMWRGCGGGLGDWGWMLGWPPGCWRSEAPTQDQSRPEGPFLYAWIPWQSVREFLLFDFFFSFKETNIFSYENCRTLHLETVFYWWTLVLIRKQIRNHASRWW